MGAQPDPSLDLWPPLRRMPDGTPCWCVSSDAPHDGWVHAPVCLARRNDRVLVIDDARTFKFPATYARTVYEADILLFRPDGWDEVWWDHDMSLRDDGNTTRVLAAKLENRWAGRADLPRCGRVVVHTANPAGRDWLVAALTRVYGRVEVVDANSWLAPGETPMYYVGPQ